MKRRRKRAERAFARWYRDVSFLSHIISSENASRRHVIINPSRPLKNVSANETIAVLDDLVAPDGALSVVAPFESVRSRSDVSVEDVPAGSKR